MKKECEIILDILPLYVDDACSASSREIVDEHLKDCPDCAAYLEQIRESEVEDELKEEQALVIKNQARRFKRRSAAAGSVVSALFMIPILVCLIVNLTSGRTLDWFYVVAAGMLVAASLTVVPIMMPESKLFWTFCAFCASLVLLLAICALTGGGDWFFTAASAALFGLAVVFLPFVIKARPLRNLIGDFSRPLIVLAADIILFANMMNMISLHSKGWPVTILMALACVAGVYLLVTAIKTKRGEA